MLTPREAEAVVEDRIELFPATDLIREPTDAVIVDRLWQPEISLSKARTSPFSRLTISVAA